MIFLVGMPCAGKTYWGKRVAQTYGWQFADMDEYIETACQKTIPAIFREEGEKAFRLKEQQALKEIIQSSAANTIVACGGGTPAFFNNMQLMQNAGCVVYLQADADTILSRLANDTERPLLQGAADIGEKINELLQQRAAFFEQADHIIPGQNISVLTFEKIIRKCTDRH